MSSQKGKRGDRSAASNSLSRDEENHYDYEKAKHERYATRGKILELECESVETAKENYLSMSFTEKRKHYRCKSEYNVLDKLQTWPEYFEESLKSKPTIDRWWITHKKDALEINQELSNKISVFEGDITTLEIDAIVNAANESLLGGGGVDGAIHRAAGKELLEECKLLGGCRAGDAKITGGYKLPARYVIHTVGPRGEKPDVLKEAYLNCLNLVKENELTTVAFPCISTGIFGYPNVNAAEVVLKTVRNWLDREEYAEKIQRIIFCLFLEQDVKVYNDLLQLYFPLERDS